MKTLFLAPFPLPEPPKNTGRPANQPPKRKLHITVFWPFSHARGPVKHGVSAPGASKNRGLAAKMGSKMQPNRRISRFSRAKPRILRYFPRVPFSEALPGRFWRLLGPLWGSSGACLPPLRASWGPSEALWPTFRELLGPPRPPVGPPGVLFGPPGFDLSASWRSFSSS